MSVGSYAYVFKGEGMVVQGECRWKPYFTITKSNQTQYWKYTDAREQNFTHPISKVQQ